jgi:DDE superfamily endonuclease
MSQRKRSAEGMMVGSICLALNQLFVQIFLKSFCSKLVVEFVKKLHHIDLCRDFSWRCYLMRPPILNIRKQAFMLVFLRIRFGAGARDGAREIFPWKIWQDAVARPIFPPLDHAVVKAIACELVAETEQPLSRQSLADITARVQKALGKPISRSTVWGILNKDAIKPWRYKYWIFPRDANFAEKAGPILDLYAGHWQGEPLGSKDYILSADEKTSIQARNRCHSPLPPAPGRPAYIEQEYEREGAVQYLAAWDVRRGYVMGRCEPATGIAPFDRLVKQVLAQEPYTSAERLFWIVDNGSSHRGETSLKRIEKIDSRIILLHTPIHASWLNQVEIYFSIIQRKVLTPNDFDSLLEIAIRLALYEELSNQTPAPFNWKFDRTKLITLLAKIEAKQKLLASAQSALKPAA